MTLFIDQMGHVSPSIERFDESGDVDRAVLPTERFHVLGHPDLERLSRYRLDALEHRLPPGLPLDELSAYVRNRSNAHGENHQVEIRAHAEGLGRHFATIPVRFEVPLFAFHELTVHQLLPVR